MKASKTIVILVCLLILPIAFLGIMGVYAFLDSYGTFENYSGWRRIEIPTESELKATVKLPDEWNFVVEDGRMKIVDTEGNVIATECYEGWYISYCEDGVHYDNKDELDVNIELPEYYRDLDNYEFKNGHSAPCYIYAITYNDVTSYALAMDIMGSRSVLGDYYIFLVFDSKYNSIELYEKIQKSYSWGGYLED